MSDEPCVDCPDEYAVAADDTTAEIDPTDPRGTNVTRWGPQLIAPYGKPTGDKRRFAMGALTHRDLPVPVKWQRADSQGHQQSVVVGTLDTVQPREDGVYGAGLLFDPDPQQLPRLAEDVAEVRELSKNGVLGPSVDLDDMEFTTLEPQGEMAAEPNTRPEIEVTKGRISAVTLVPIPAFAEVGPLEFSTMPAVEYLAGNLALTASVNTGGWASMPLAPPGTSWDAGAAQQRVKSWSGGDMDKYAKAFLWADPDAGDNLGGYKFPIADVIGGDLKIVPKAVRTAAGVLNGAMGGTTIPTADQKQMRSTLASITKRFDPDGDGDDDRSPGTDTDKDKGSGKAEMSLASLGPVEFAEVMMASEELVTTAEDDAAYGVRFAKLMASLKGKVDDPGAVAATIGRKKYGAQGMARLRAGVAPGKVKALAASAALSTMVDAAVSGDWSTAVEPFEHLSNLVAAGTPVDAAAPAEWFANPGLTEPTPLQITPEGRVYGHLADWRSCHTGFAGCVRAPKSRSNYAYFHLGETMTTDGPLPVGKITLAGGHANLSSGFRAAAEHYDNSTTAVAEVRAGEDKFGIWVAGRVLPEVMGTAREAELRRSPLSGDWREIGGQPEMIAALAVNAPGFAIPRAQVHMTASAGQDDATSGKITTIVAAGVLTPPQGLSANGAGLTEDVLARVAREAAELALAGQSTYARRAKAAALLKQIDDDGDQADDLKRKRRAMVAKMATTRPAGMGPSNGM